MDAKPADFFVGITDFFAVLLPGALLTAFLIPYAQHRLFGPVLPPLENDFTKAVAFLLASYLLGSFVFLAASFLDRPYGWIRQRYLARNRDELFLYATVLKNRVLGLRSRTINTYQWSKTALHLHHPEAIVEIHRFEAHSKFFRSFVVVLFLVAVLLLCNRLWLEAALALALLALSFWRYLEQRDKSIAIAYQYLVTAELTAAHQPAAAPQASANATPPQEPGMQELFKRLITEHYVSGPDSDAVKSLIEDIVKKYPGQKDAVDSFRRVWRVSHGLPPEEPQTSPSARTASALSALGAVPPTPPASATSQWLSRGGLLALGGSLAAVFYDYYAASDSSHLRDLLARYPVSSPIGLLGVLALLGGVGGVLNAWLAGTVKILPASVPLDGSSVAVPGWLGNVVSGAISALITVGVAGWPSGSSAGENLLTPVLALTAFAAGFGGSRIVTGQRDTSLLWKTVASALVRPADPVVAGDVQRARSVNEVVSLVHSTQAAGNAADLLACFDQTALRDLFAELRAQGKPEILTPKSGLPLFVLARFLPFAQFRSTFGRLPISLATGATLATFTATAASLGIEEAAIATALAELWNNARTVADLLSRVPADWQLTPARLTPNP